MKVRIKFSKDGVMKFIGHLDVMRYFQKAIRRAQLPAAYSEGFSPHMLLSFAAPLGVGLTSEGEYFDLQLTREIPTDEICQRLNQTMAEGMKVLSARKIPDGRSSNAMSLVAAADYLITFREGKAPAKDWQSKIVSFYDQPEIIVEKRTKRGVKQIDIRPFIYDMHGQDNGIFLRLASASSNYTKPELVMKAFGEYLKEEPAPFAFLIRRLEIYTVKEEESAPLFCSLEELGEEIV